MIFMMAKLLLIFTYQLYINHKLGFVINSMTIRNDIENGILNHWMIIDECTSYIDNDSMYYRVHLNIIHTFEKIGANYQVG